MFTEGLEDHDYSVEKTLAIHAGISVDIAKQLTRNMPLGSYMDLVNALDNDDEAEITRIVDEYMFSEIKNESFVYFKENFNASELVIKEEEFFNLKLSSLL